MKKKSFIIGVGIGLILSSFIFIGAYKLDELKDNEKIIDSARKLGMVFYKEVAPKEDLFIIEF
jgi:predicted small secreted protein